MALLIMAICTVLFENITFKIERAQGARDNQCFFQMFKIMRCLIFKMFKING